MFHFCLSRCVGRGSGPCTSLQGHTGTVGGVGGTPDVPHRALAPKGGKHPEEAQLAAPASGTVSFCTSHTISPCRRLTTCPPRPPRASGAASTACPASGPSSSTAASTSAPTIAAAGGAGAAARRSRCAASRTRATRRVGRAWGLRGCGTVHACRCCPFCMQPRPLVCLRVLGALWGGYAGGATLHLCCYQQMLSPAEALPPLRVMSGNRADAVPLAPRQPPTTCCCRHPLRGRAIRPGVGHHARRAQVIDQATCPSASHE